MSGAVATLKMLLVGEDRSLSKVLHGAAGEADKTGSKLHGMASKTNVAVLAIAGSAAAFGKSSMSAFKEVGGQAIGLQRVMGGTIEDASRLRFAGEETGVSFETLSKSTGKLSKALVGANASTSAHSAMVKTLGFEYTDAAGKVLPMAQLLPQISDKFAKMPNGPEKTALAMKLFGKAGADMLPLLNKGADGIGELEKESDKFGNTISGKNAAALKAAKMSQREWNASLQGLKIQIGAQLLPILMTFVGFIREHVMPVIQKTTAFIQDHKNAVGIAAVIIGTLIVGIKAWTIAQGILNTVMAMNPIALVVIALAALAAGLILAYQKSETFRDIVKAAFDVVKTVVEVSVIAPIRMIAAVVGAVIAFVRDHWKLILGILTGPIGAAVIAIMSHWSSIKSGFMGVVTFIRDKVAAIVGFFAGLPGEIGKLAGKMAGAGKALMMSWWDGFKGAASGAAHFVGQIVSDVGQGIKDVLNDVLHLPWHLPEFKIGAFGHYVHVGGQTLFPRLAQGGMVQGPGLFMMGDNPTGQEVALPLGSRKTTEALGAAFSEAGMSGGGGSTVVQVSFGSGVILGSPAEVGKAVKRALEEVAAQGIRLNIGRAIVSA